ncbi:MAG: GNAT family N-acetyltransferase [Candidatus Heimdallarchaeota archaeon]|nr:GNAT family N-acetyltransferase [Candidatus Heimdallarchaeota archaeon]
MTLTFKQYKHSTDFNRIREYFIKEHETTYPYIWTFERWNYMAYFIRDMFEFSIEMLEDTLGIWENEQGEIIGTVTHEAVGRGEAFIHLHPKYYTDTVLLEMFTFIEEKMSAESEGKKILKLRILDGNEELEDFAAKRGYIKKETAVETTSMLSLDGELVLPKLPEGYRIQSMADDNDIDKRTLTFAKAFGNYGTENQIQPHSYIELQKCPDYRKNLDVYIVSPDEEFVSFCLIWYDEKNNLGILEPVGTNPDHRKKGLAKAAVYEAINRVRREGAEKIYVGDGQQFYLSIGFEHNSRNVVWIKETEL